MNVSQHDIAGNVTFNDIGFGKNMTLSDSRTPVRCLETSGRRCRIVAVMNAVDFDSLWRETLKVHRHMLGKLLLGSERSV